MPGRECPSCRAELRTGWQFCPACSAALPPSCVGCGEQLLATWKRCPICGLPVDATHVQTVQQAAPNDAGPLLPVEQTGDTRGLAWGLHDRLALAFFAPFSPIGEQIERAESVAKLLHARDPAAFVRATGTGFSAILKCREDQSLPQTVREAFVRLNSHRDRLLAGLDPTARHVRECAAEVRGLSLPAGTMNEFLTGAAQAANPTTRAGLGALGGAALGTVLLPGIGTAIGGAIGAMVGGAQMDGENQLVLEKYEQAFAQLGPAVVEVFNQTWDQLVRDLREAGGPDLCGSGTIIRTEEAWTTLAPTLSRDIAGHGEVSKFLETHGPYPDAVGVMFAGCLLFGWGEKHVEARWWLDTLERLFPTRPDTLLHRAQWHLEVGEHQQALDALVRGTEIDRTHVGLRLGRIEALGAAGRDSEAQVAVREHLSAGTAGDPWLSYAYGVERRKDPAALATAVRLWVREVSPPALARLIRNDFWLGKHFAAIAARVSELSRYANGRSGELRAIVETFLSADNAGTFLGEAAVERLQCANPGFLTTSWDEQLLYFWDWSLWGTASTGMAITTTRVVWNSFWNGKCEFSFRTTSPDQVRSDAQMVHLSQFRLDAGTPEFALLLVQTIAELVSIHARSEHRPG